MANCLIKRSGGGVDCDNATATAADVLEGKTFGGKSSDELIRGTMTNRGTYNKSVTLNSAVIIPAGYHNGTGKITYPLSTKAGGTYTPKASDQTIPVQGYYLTSDIIRKGDSFLKPENILIGKKIFGVTGTFRDTAYNTAYNGSSFSPLFAGGMTTGLINWPGEDNTYSSAEYGAKYFNYSSDDRPLNKVVTSGELTLQASDYGSSGWTTTIGYRTTNRIDLSPYKRVVVTIQTDVNKDQTYYHTDTSRAYLTLINQDGTLYQELKATSGGQTHTWECTQVGYSSPLQPQIYVGTYDISSINATVYMGFGFFVFFNSTNNNYHKYYNGMITQIVFS